MRVFKTEQVDAKKAIDDALAHVELGSEATFGDMTIFPLLDRRNGSPDYLTLDEGLARGLVQITEVSVEGRVPDLKFTNESDESVFLLDGEELIGAKQNRVLNLTILAPAKRTIVIPVSCVEAGRWSRRSPKFTTSSRAHFARGRAHRMAQVSHSLQASGERRSDQHMVWEEIGAKAGRLKVASPTSAMADIYETYMKRVNEYADGFTAGDQQTGAAFVINGEVIGFDLFDSSATLKKLLPKLVRSYALDAIEAVTERGGVASRSAVEDLLLAVSQAEAKTFPAVGEGVDVRLSGPDLTVAGLLAKGRVVHLSAFRLEAMRKGHD
jgi:hypothetical protein